MVAVNWTCYPNMTFSFNYNTAFCFSSSKCTRFKLSCKIAVAMPSGPVNPCESYFYVNIWQAIIYFSSFCVVQQVQCGQQSITGGVAQPDHYPLHGEWKMVVGPPGGSTKHSSHRIQYKDIKCELIRRGAVRVFHPHKQETRVNKSAPHRTR